MPKTITIVLAALAVALLGATAALAPPQAAAAQIGNAVSPPAPQGASLPQAQSTPAVSLIAFGAYPRNGDTYRLGDTIRVTVKFSRAVTVTGTPQLELTIGSDRHQADYFYGSGSRHLKFSYTVQAADRDTNGVSIAANALSLNSGTIRAGTQDATLTHTGVADDATRKVDGGGGNTDYDTNDNGLIDVDSLAKLDAVRWDMNGDGAVDTGTSVADTAKYNAAFPDALAGMGCLRDHDANTATAKVAGCIGYELTRNLDFDTNGSGATYTTSSTGTVTGDSGDTYYNGNAGWTPLGGHQETANRDFTATFEGNDYTVSNLYINLATTGANDGNYVGLFGDLAATGKIRNVGLVDPYVANARGGAGLSRTGALAGRNNGGTVSGIYMSGGSVSGNYQIPRILSNTVGGLVGWNYGTVRDSYATGTVTSSDTAGGLVGYFSGGLVTDSYATGAVSASAGRATAHAGGLVGFLHSGAGMGVIASYATGTVSASGGSSNAGGLVGGLAVGYVRASYATGAVSTSGDSGYAGGLVGDLGNSASIIASYATSAVSTSGGGTNRLGGLVGNVSGTGTSVTNSYWDTQTSGQAASAAGVGKTTSELQSPTGYTGIYAGWNLNLDGQAGNDDPWYFGAANQYPALRYGGHDLHIQLVGDYDLDDDGLIEVDSLAQLDAIRWDLNGDGAVDTVTSVADTAKYHAAFSNVLTGMGCLRDHDDATTAKVAGCIGYELTRDLDFDENNDGNITSADDDYWNGGKGWKPIGEVWAKQFTATFDGNGKTISNLFIKDTAATYVGLFGVIGTGGRVERLGMQNVNVTGLRDVGGLVGNNGGTISASYATGSVAGDANVGGLVGSNDGTISASYATSSVNGGAPVGTLGVDVGGLVGYNRGTISASYATGSVTVGYHGMAGGLAGINGYGGTVRDSYATGSVTSTRSGSGGSLGGLVSVNGGIISASYATGPVAGGGQVGGLVGGNGGTISASYATGSVTESTGPTEGSAGGLVGSNGGPISASYATGSVIGNYLVGGLVGWNGGTISTTYATGSVTGTSHVGGLAGMNASSSSTWPRAITNSYATGAVKGTGSNVGGLVGSDTSDTWTYKGTTTNSYWDTGTTGQATSAGGIGKTTRDLQSPAGYSGIYAAWNTNLDGVAGNDDPWDFGVNRQHPVLNYGGLDLTKQRQTAIRSDNWNAPVVGEPVVASLNVTGATGITWQWQSSTNGSTWTDISNATGATYVPVTADVGKYLRAKATFTASGSSRTLVTVNTAKVVATATAAATTTGPAVGVKIQYDVSVTGATDHAWRWQRCDNAGMTTNCAYVAAATAATAEYTPVAGDVGKYLRAYVYYAANDAGKTWTRAESPVLGLVVAAPAASQ